MRRRGRVPYGQKQIAWRNAFIVGREDGEQGKDHDYSSYRGDPNRMDGYDDGYRHGLTILEANQ